MILDHQTSYHSLTNGFIWIYDGDYVPPVNGDFYNPSDFITLNFSNGVFHRTTPTWLNQRRDR